ncbi:acyl-CoA dehydrogenase family protein [Amycolatopsis rifamycinica]|uniref:acyl-CoA dehydrogenase family protein n=1 Tax=Amycolatopsis rifamycinica TaxID=287986 RepID=UPI000B0B246B|nr:acyl-CoA dehydrogenase family protein [Amycolatopsis rifamycinica]
MPEAALLDGGRGLSTVDSDADGGRVWRRLGADGVLREQYRRRTPTGLVADPGRLGATLRAVDARGDNGITLSVLVQSASALPILAAGTGPEFDRVADGDCEVALAATDAAAAGSDLTGLGTEVEIDGDTVRLEGSKRWVTTATRAAYFLVLARHRAGRHFTAFTWVLVPADAAGVRVTPATTTLLAGAGIGHVEFSGVRLPSSAVLGRQGRGLALFARHMGTERLAGAQWATALTSRVLAETRTSLTRREIDGRALWDHDPVRQEFAGCLVRVRALRALHEALGERVVEEHDATSAATLKAAVGLTADDVLSRCARWRGADGFADDGLQLVRAEAAVFGIGGGVTELMLGAVADGAETLLAELRA